MIKLNFTFKLQNKRRPETLALHNPIKRQEGESTLPRTRLKSWGGCSWQQAWDVLLKIAGWLHRGEKHELRMKDSGFSSSAVSSSTWGVSLELWLIVISLSSRPPGCHADIHHSLSVWCKYFAPNPAASVPALWVWAVCQGQGVRGDT